MVLPLLALVLIGIPIIEIYLIVQASHAIGFLETVAVLVVISIVGAWLVKRQGLRVWARFNEAVAAGRVPSKEIAQGVCLLIAGALMVTPGFFTDALGVLLLLPPSQALLLRLLRRRASGRTRVIRATYGGRVYDTSVHDDTERPPRGELDP